MGLPLACVVLLSRQCRVCFGTCQPLPSWRAAVALPRRFGRVCWDLAALRRGAGRRVPLPIRIACPTGKCDGQLLGTTRTMVERRRGLSHASEESSHRRLGARTNDGIFHPPEIEHGHGSTDAAVAAASMRKIMR